VTRSEIVHFSNSPKYKLPTATELTFAMLIGIDCELSVSHDSIQDRSSISTFPKNNLKSGIIPKK
jgi:hypothetical protein